MRLFFVKTSNSHLSLSIAYTIVACYTTTCTSMDSCFSTSTTFSSLASFCIIYASTECYSTTSSSSDSSMNTESTNAVSSLVFLLHANVFCFYVKTQFQMFQLYLCLELFSAQIVSFHYMPSLLHILKMMMNAMVTL